MNGIEPVELHAGPYRLRLATESDIDAALEMSYDPAIRQWYPTRITDRESAERWLRRGSDWSGGHHATWVVADTADRLVGSFSLVHIDQDDQFGAQVSYRTAPWARDRGVASYALVAATRWAFAALNLERLELPHAVANPASCRVAQKTGYRQEGLLRLGFRDDLGRRWDSHLHAHLVTAPDPDHPVDDRWPDGNFTGTGL
jgi:RimJ/RimL family protein N-acetyltransferase